MTDQQTLKAMRITVLVFTACVLTYAITMQGTSIYELVSGAYQVPLVGAFVPLVFGLYWKRATTQGALLHRGAWAWGSGCCLWPAPCWRRPSRSNWPGCWRRWWACWRLAGAAVD
jgi:hypothetical protein